MSSNPTDVAFELQRAQTLIDLNRNDEACALLQKLLGREPDNVAAWCLLAQAQHRADRPHDALAAASHAAALAPEDDWPYRLRSIAFQALGADESAVAAAREAVRVGPYHWQCHLRLAISLVVAKGDLEEARAAAERGLELAPYEPDAHYALGLVAEAAKNHEEAELCFREALALDPEHSPSHNALASMHLHAGGFGRPGKLAAAASGYRDAIQADPRAGHSARNLELVLRHFIARVSYLILVIVWLASRVSGGTLVDRVGPLLLLLIPAAFAVRFLAGLPPDLRRQVRWIAFRGPLALPVFVQACAVALLFVAAAVPSDTRGAILAAALLTSLAARILIARRNKSPLFPWSGWFKRRRA